MTIASLILSEQSFIIESSFYRPDFPPMIQAVNNSLHSLDIPERQATIEEYEMA